MAPRARSLPRLLFAVALVLLGAGAFLVSTAYDNDPQATVGTDPAIDARAADPADLSANNSPTLVRSPVDARRLAVANRVDLPRFSCALHVSSDGGESWSKARIPLPRGEGGKCYAPDLAYGADGTLYVSFVTLRGPGNVPHAAWISRSRNGGRSLSRPVKALGPLSFQVRLAADPDRPGRLYLTWVRGADVALYKFTTTRNPIVAARSDDGGRSFRKPVRVSDAARRRVVAPSPVIGPRGELYVLYLDLGGDRLDYEGLHEGRGGPPYKGAWKLVLARSRDGGRNWQESVVSSKLAPTERFIVFIPPFPSLAVDRKSGRLYAAFEDGGLGDPDVLVWSRGRKDEGWSDPVRVNDTPERDGRAQYRPALSVAPGGRLDVVYYDRRSDPTNVRNEVSLQSSYDAGASFRPRLRLSDRGFDSRIGFGSERDMTDLGSRLALLATDADALAVWTDTRSGSRVTGKQDLVRAGVAFSDPARLPGPLDLVLRYGGPALALAGVLVLVALLRHRRRGEDPPRPKSTGTPA